MSVQFTEEMIQGAVATEKKTGVPASITLGQLVLESGYNSPNNLSGLAKNYNNYFGVKYNSNWTGARTPYLTNSNGEDGAYYRWYNNTTESFLDHAKIFELDRYQQYFQNATSVEDYAWGLQKGGYATDPNYATKLINTIKTNNLTQYDSLDYGDISTLNAFNEDYKNNITQTSNSNWYDGILKKVLYFVIFLLVVVVAIVSFMKAFDISPTSALIDVAMKKFKIDDLVKKGE